MTIFSTLSNRIFVASAALTLLCISTAIYVVNRRVTETAEEELRRELVQSAALVDEQRQSVSDLFIVFASAVADLPKLKAAVATDDPPTVGPIAADYARAVHASLLLVTDRSGRVLAERVESAPSIGASGLPSVEGALGGRVMAAFWVFPGGILQVISVPIVAGAAPPEILGSLSLGFQLDDALAARFKAQTGSEIAFASGSRVVASTLLPAERGPLASLAARAGITRVWCGSVEYLALVRPLVSRQSPSMSAAPVGPPAVAGPRDGTPAPPVAIILRSRTERLRLLQPIRAALLGTGALAMLLAIGLSYGIARTITRPIGVITATMKEMSATGDLEKKITWPSSRWTDEDARLLATTFNSMTASISRFQREASLRERLSSLGRLSTVIAHEVRNPLMIIKGALRPLFAGSPSPAEVREAAADIDGEVSRLNRLVNDVLDFARPLRFDMGPTDVNALCAQCAATVEGGDALGPLVRVISDPSVPVLVTDGERLRSVLVNLLANARHAVVARNGGPPPDDAGPQVEIETRRLDGGVAIDVRDRGVGIEPENLPRVFEPYFTTSRGGTGLGLAISRNIVEGLGGTIRITSRAGSGTDVQVELWNATGARPAD
jgi:signal transduction histidine kinase